LIKGDFVIGLLSGSSDTSSGNGDVIGIADTQRSISSGSIQGGNGRQERRSAAARRLFRDRCCGNGYVDAVGVVRRHSIAAAKTITIVTTNSPSSSSSTSRATTMKRPLTRWLSRLGP
jgi:hypothetical protein